MENILGERVGAANPLGIAFELVTDPKPADLLPPRGARDEPSARPDQNLVKLYLAVQAWAEKSVPVEQESGPKAAAQKAAAPKQAEEPPDSSVGSPRAGRHPTLCPAPAGFASSGSAAPSGHAAAVPNYLAASPDALLVPRELLAGQGKKEGKPQ
jgi:hypothetical protein